MSTLIVKLMYGVIIVSLLMLILFPIIYHYVTAIDRDVALYMLIGDVVLFILVFWVMHTWD